jgi:D-alanine transaminase
MSTPSKTPCFLNGELLPLQDAKVSVMDRGFIFGDGVYEVIPVYRGVPFGLMRHLQRLRQSLAALRIPSPYTPEEWIAIFKSLLQHPGLPVSANHTLYLQITRGVAPREHSMPVGLTPTVFVMVSALHPMHDTWRSQGVACVSADDFRWLKGHIKSTSLLGAVLSRQISADVGAAETVMFRGDYLSEAAASNVWVVKDGCVLGVPTDGQILVGIRYGLIGELCEHLGIGFALRPIHRDEVLAADELWLSSATKEVVPITSLDGVAVGDGLPGPIYASVYSAYQAAISASSWE